MNLLLLALMLGSCLYLVKTSYESRKLFTALERARAEQTKLDTQFKRLDAEAQGQATHLRVEQVARDKLRMRTATPAVTQYVFDEVAAAALPLAAAPGASTSTSTAAGAGSAGSAAKAAAR
ncbi:MAG: cell division protein FtsL [Rubrivivax sp.]